MKNYFIIVIGCWLLFSACGKNSSTWTNKIDGLDFVLIPAEEIKGFVNFNNKDSVVVKVVEHDFYMATTEVSVRQFATFAKETGFTTTAELDSNKFTWTNPGYDQTENHPVVWVSYADANAYADWAGVAIPTEEQWFRAFKAGTSTNFFWGDSLNDDYMWNRANTNGIRPAVVGTKLPNPWGVFNMAGNIREYVYVCDSTFNLRGSSWTRCPKYFVRQGYWAEDMIKNELAPNWSSCTPKWKPYPYDDDRGIRCVKNVN